MFREKLSFIISSTIRSNKMAKRFRKEKKVEVAKQTINTITQKLSDLAPFEITNTTKIIIFAFAAPFILRQVFLFSFSKPLSYAYQRYLDFNLTAIGTGMALFVCFKMINRQESILAKACFQSARTSS